VPLPRRGTHGYFSGPVTPTVCWRRLAPRCPTCTATADPIDHLLPGYLDGPTHRHPPRAEAPAISVTRTHPGGAAARKRQRFMTPILPKTHQPDRHRPSTRRQSKTRSTSDPAVFSKTRSLTELFTQVHRPQTLGTAWRGDMTKTSEWSELSTHAPTDLGGLRVPA